MPMKTALALFAFFVAAAHCAGHALAAEIGKGPIAVPNVAAAPPLDGMLGEAWKQAVAVPLVYDSHLHSASAEPTTAYVMTDGKALYVAFDARQTRASILTTQRTNDVGLDSDDEVQVSLWPSGSQGFAYQFISTPIGTRYQSSSENSTYEPLWQAAGHVERGRYLVTMRIPFSIMRGAGSGHWLMQLSRWEPTTGSLYVMNGGETIQNSMDVNFAQPLANMPSVAAARPQPRFAAYGLGAVAAPSAGGSTSRAGVDFAIPVSAGTSFVGTIHPDFSNVENDQQTIAPSAFARFYQETRPFFAQGASAYNVFECDECQSISTLYTPSIPTPRTGYAVEGKEGRYTFGAFDAVGAGRDDTAASVAYRTLPRTLLVALQRVNVNMPGFQDTSYALSSKWSDQKHKFLFANFSQETGTNVTDASSAKMRMIGGGWYGANTWIAGNIAKMGSQYAPYDGFVPLNDLAGYGAFRQQTWNPQGGTLKHVSFVGYVDRYHGTTGGLNDADQGLNLDLTTRTLWDLQAQSGATYTAISGIMTPLTQNQYTLTYHAGTATPSSLAFASGEYGAGRLNAWYRSSTIALGRRYTMTLEADNTEQFLASGTNAQWLERLSFAFQTSQNSSFAIGLRRFSGQAPAPNGGSCEGTCTNISFAYHKRFDKRELYVAYGNPSPLFTVPQFIVKLIDYVGADKGA